MNFLHFCVALFVAALAIIFGLAFMQPTVLAKFFRQKTYKIILAGPPASGKGTMGEVLVKELNATVIGTGNILRAEAASGSEVGVKIREVMAAGGLVSDDLVIPAVVSQLEARKEGGWILDGFPRSAAQGEAFAKMIKENDFARPSLILLLEVDDEVAVDRISGRRIDPVTDKVYHVKTNPPPTQEIADRCITREDDTEDRVRERLRIYHENTPKWVHAIEAVGGIPVIRVDAAQPVAAVKAAIDAEIRRYDFLTFLSKITNCGSLVKAC